jgi:tRNA A-37 threonylcarbamoyl transferase component Bud32
MESAGPGRLIAGRYRLNAVIGRGGMGVVWRARDELLGRDVAVKELAWPEHFSEREQRAARQCAAREAQAAARVSHPNVIRIFDVIEEDDCPWIVMELLPRGSLHDLIRREGPLSPAQAAAVGLGILAALRAAHAEGIVHRDVKPANILLAEDRVVLTDFGIAQAAGTSALTTAVDVLIGSPAYIAPERARGRQCGPPADLWGLGASLYAAVEGRGPFDRDGDALASLAAVVADEPPPATRAGRLLWPVISALLRKDPGKRPSAAETEGMLRRVAAPAGAAASRPRRPQVLAAAFVGSAALAVLTVSGLVLASPPRHQTASVTTIAPPAAASTRPPAVSKPAPALGKHPKAPAEPRLAARTSLAPAQSSPPSGNTGADTVAQRGPRGRTGRFAFYLPGPALRAYGTRRAGRPPGAGHGRRQENRPSTGEFRRR